MMTINYFCRDTFGSIIKKDETAIGETPSFVVETLAIRVALMYAIQKNYSKVIIESIAIQAINEKSIPSIHICTLVQDISR